MKKGSWINWIIVFLVLLVAFYIILRPSAPTTTEEIAKCIGGKSTLYVQLGCSHCKIQEDMFGDYKSDLKIVDCFYERDKCSEIGVTPTWLINGEYIEGVQDIDKLRELTGC